MKADAGSKRQGGFETRPYDVTLLSREQFSIGADSMAMSRGHARTEHAAQAGAAHDQFTETIYAVVCAGCHNYSGN